MTSHDISLQRFEVEPLGIKDLKVWKRSPVELMTDMLQDPDYTDKIDWLRASPFLPGVFASVTEWILVQGGQGNQLSHFITMPEIGQSNVTLWA